MKPYSHEGCSHCGENGCFEEIESLRTQVDEWSGMYTLCNKRESELKAKVEELIRESAMAQAALSKAEAQVEAQAKEIERLLDVTREYRGDLRDAKSDSGILMLENGALQTTVSNLRGDKLKLYNRLANTHHVWKNAEDRVRAQDKQIERLVKVVVRAKYLISIVPDNDAWFEDAEAALRRGEGGE